MVKNIFTEYISLKKPYIILLNLLKKKKFIEKKVGNISILLGVKILIITKNEK